jgi:hypothetical protein
MSKDAGCETETETSSSLTRIKVESGPDFKTAMERDKGGVPDVHPRLLAPRELRGFHEDGIVGVGPPFIFDNDGVDARHVAEKLKFVKV